MDKTSRIFVAGHRGLVGSAIIRRLQKADYRDLLTRTRGELDLTDAAQVTRFFKVEAPSHVFLAAAKVGGIAANDAYRADFLRENLQIQTNVIDAAYRAGTQKLLFLGSSCIYPKFAPQPIREDSLLTGPLEPTNEAYAIAKIAGIAMCQAYRKQHGFDAISLMPTNLYGPNDNFDLTSSHVLPALMRKIHEAKLADAPSVTVWGSGTPRREFLHVDDMADACVFLMKTYSSGDIVNVGMGDDISIADLARLIGEIVGYKGQLVFDTSKPDGTPRKLLDVSRLTAAGWMARTSLRDGIAATYRWYLDHVAAGDARGVAAQ
jgi:GDP-L-fucose synthase